ncbi:MAG: sel1 repeat family protein, partial [Prevotellaceae bacterium]|jgi:TPR repeat protein|nr:sel1 repeat family protein [Prevotellaceae bacterium]
MYLNGTGVKQDYGEAVKWFRKSAEQGEAHGQNILGVMYLYGTAGVKQDYGEAVKWFRKSAEQGLAQGQDYLGLMYDNGFGIEQDRKEAIKWYRKAAKQGYEAAINRLEKLDELD